MRDNAILLRAKQNVIDYGCRALADGLLIGTAGNFSVRLDDAIVITPSAVPYEAMTVDQVAVVDLATGELRSGLPPSSETPMHLATYRRYRAGGVVHTHSRFVVALSTVLDVLPAVHYAIVRLGGPVRVAPYARFGTEDLARVAIGGLADRRAVILRNHGALAYGASLAEAYERASVLEWLASTYWYASLAGSPVLLDQQQLDEVAAAQTQRREES